MALTNNPLDPDQIASHNFGTSFRGFEQAEVRTYLRQVAEAVRSERTDIQRAVSNAGGQATKIGALKGEIEQLRSDSVQMRDELRQANEELATRGPKPQRVLPEDLDEGQLTQLLGEETVRVLDSARSVAADITAKAEKEASDRTQALDKQQRETTKSLSNERKQADEEVAALRSKAESEAKTVVRDAAAEAERVNREATEAAEKARSEARTDTTKLTEEATTSAAASKKAAQEVAAAVKQRGEEVARETRLLAETDGESMRKAAGQVMSDAEAEAARVRAEAAADVETARDSAREEARLMLTEAQALREKVLEDLVRRRRVARQQIDQAKAARDRLARALVSARSQVDSATAELDVSVPEAKRAMDRVGVSSAGTEADQMADIAKGLDQARLKGKTLSAEVIANPVAGSGGGRKKAIEPKSASKSLPAEEGRESKDSEVVEASTADLLGDVSDGGVESDAGDALDDIFARIRAERTDDDVSSGSAPASISSQDELSESTAEPSDSEDVQGKPEMTGPENSVVEETGSNASPQGAAPERAAEAVEVLPPFADRDIALTRFGPDLRRKLKRAVADDQSDVLDRLRRAKILSSDELPDPDEQLAGYRKAAASGLVDIATAGSRSLGGPKIGVSQVSAILDQVAKGLHGPLRAKIERSIAAADGDSSEVFEPIRAHYRDARSVSLPELIEDAVAEAFAVGAYDAIDHAARLVWVVDPRTETSPDCFDNTLENSVVKPKAFPTGHQRPLGGPGCRCLVLPADQYGSSE